MISMMIFDGIVVVNVVVIVVVSVIFIIVVGKGGTFSFSLTKMKSFRFIQRCVSRFGQTLIICFDSDLEHSLFLHLVSRPYTLGVYTLGVTLWGSTLWGS